MPDNSRLSSMTLDQLKALKKRWYDSAITGPDCVVSCLVRLARMRGTKQGNTPSLNYVFKVGNIRVSYLVAQDDISVMVNSQFKLSNELFVPGEWLEKLLPFMEEAREQEEEAKRLGLLDLLGDE